MDNEGEINFKIFIFIGIILLFVFAIVFLPGILEPPKKINITKNITAIPPVIITKYVYITPTADNGIYYASEYKEGIRKLKRPFSFIRYNALGKQDMVIHTSVYDYRIFSKYHWFNPSDYKYYTIYPSGSKSKFLFVFINIYLDNIIGKDTRFWIPPEKDYAVQIKNTIYKPITFTKQLRIAELENVYNFNDDQRVVYYNSIRIYSRNEEFSTTAGETYQTIDVLKGGKSNAIDGYIVFEIPEDSREEDITVLGGFYSFGNSQWVLKI